MGETWACTWLVDRGFTEDGEPWIEECGAVARAVDEEGSWICDGGHAHVSYVKACEIGLDIDRATHADHAAILRGEGLPF